MSQLRKLDIIKQTEFLLLLFNFSVFHSSSNRTLLYKNIPTNVFCTVKIVTEIYMFRQPFNPSVQIVVADFKKEKKPV